MPSQELVLPQELTAKGFSLSVAELSDVQDFVHITRLGLKKYVDADSEFFGQWDDKLVVEDFNHKMNHTSFQKLLLHGEIAGFMAYDIRDNEIGGISINLAEKARNNGIGSLYLTHIVRLSKQSAKPAFLKVMKTNPARLLYERFGFTVCDDAGPLYTMTYSS